MNSTQQQVQRMNKQTLRLSLTNYETFAYSSGSRITVGGWTVRDLEQVLYTDSNFTDKIVGTWQFFRVNNVTVKFVPRYRFPQTSSEDGIVTVLGLSAGKDYGNQKALAVNAPIDTTMELPSSTTFHSFDYRSISLPIADRKWYPVEDDEVNPATRRQYDIWLLYNYLIGQNTVETLGYVLITFDLELKGLLI